MPLPTPTGEGGLAPSPRRTAPLCHNTSRRRRGSGAKYTTARTTQTGRRCMCSRADLGPLGLSPADRVPFVQLPPLPSIPLKAPTNTGLTRGTYAQSSAAKAAEQEQTPPGPSTTPAARLLHSTWCISLLASSSPSLPPRISLPLGRSPRTGRQSLADCLPHLQKITYAVPYLVGTCPEQVISSRRQ